MKRKQCIITGVWIIILAAFMLLPRSVQAADISLSQVLYADSQREVVGPVLVRPGTQRKMIVRVTNGDQDTHINIGVDAALTNDFGQLADQHTVKRTTLDNALSWPKIVSGLPKEKVPMAAGETKDFPFTVAIPAAEQPASALIVGSISVGVANINTLIGGGGTTFSTNIQVRISAAPLPQARVDFTQAAAGEYNGRDGITVDVANHVGNIFAAQSITGDIRAVDQAIQPRRRTLKRIKMAPHSNFTFFIPHADLRMGKYVVTMAARQKNKTVKQQTFAVTVDRRLATAASKAELQTQVLIQRWLMGIAVGGVVVIALIFAVRHIRRRRREAAQ
jgi:hypothetical protein